MDKLVSAMEDAMEYQSKFESDVVNHELIKANPELKELAEKISGKLAELNKKVNQQAE